MSSKPAVKKPVAKKAAATKSADKPKKPETSKYSAKCRYKHLERIALKSLRRKKIARSLKTEMIRRAQKYLTEYRKADEQAIELKRKAIKEGNLYCPDEPKLAFVVRIRGINGIAPKPRKILQLFRLRQINNGVFVKLNKATLNMLRIIDPYIMWGYPSLKTVRQLIYKRGFIRFGGRREPLSNQLIMRKVGHLGMICVEDVVHEIFTVGPNFKAASSLLWHFKLNNPTGGFRKKTNHFVEGGDFGNREEYINRILSVMI
ncbi:60S ribosomal protein L7 [Cichlidogyrus casuarinus]|uniref:Large ribosomal subunit protein uL30 n=1 Tax=Cichlidogyrus casuarinus TaxID=1844966 RepID=A0ABD2Q9D4_9PLAT